MRILLTNDDGIHSPAFPSLIEALKRFGDVTVVAPAEEQSGKSQAIDFRNAIDVKKVDVFPGVDAYSVASTPADCVRFGVLALKSQYDLVISGINRGYNLGADIAYSGTVGAILEAAHLGIKGIALSSSPEYFLDAVAHLDQVADFICEKRLFDFGELYNINIPPHAEKFAITKTGGTFYSDAFEKIGDGKYMQVGYPVEYHVNGTETDIDAVRSGVISISPLTHSRLNLPAFDALKTLLTDN